MNSFKNSLLDVSRQKCQTTGKESESSFSCDVILTEKGAEQVNEKEVEEEIDVIDPEALKLEAMKIKREVLIDKRKI